jgi:oligopeptide/dipeptide ABC transporter ATP-binding protein
MSEAQAMLSLRDVSLRIRVEDEDRLILDRVGFEVRPGEALGLVGESGSGKSMTLRSILGLLPDGATLDGEIVCEGQDLRRLRRADLRRFRGSEVAMIFQDPRAHVNPVRTVGDFLTEALIINRGVRAKEARRRVEGLLREVGIADAGRRLGQYPHELSGGLLQRVMIASALAVDPKLILADEPTTALDVTTQEEVMAILDELRRERGLAMVFVSHDLDLATAICDRTAVMYAGTVVEVGGARELREAPAHPYTEALLTARPRLDAGPRQPLKAIRGRPTPAYEAPPGCPFMPRCEHAVDACADERPVLRPVGVGEAACLRAEEVLAGA